MEAALGITASCVATFRPLFKSCGFGWHSRKRDRSSHYQLQQEPRDGFSRTTKPTTAGFGPASDIINDKSDHDGSEHELTIRKTGKIDVTSVTEEYPNPLVSSPRKKAFDKDLADFPGRARSYDWTYATDPEDMMVYNNRETV